MKDETEELQRKENEKEEPQKKEDEKEELQEEEESKKEEQQKEESLDDSTLSIQSEIEGQQNALKLLKNRKVHKDSKQDGGFKSIKIIGEQDKPEFIQFVNNKETTGKATNDNVFGYEECFYHAVLRTIENEKGIKFICKNIQRFAGVSLCNAADDGGDDVTLCLFLIASLFHQVDNSQFLMSMLKEDISYAVKNMLLLKPDNDGKLKEMYNYATTKSSTGKSRREREQKWLQAICEKLKTIIDLFTEDKKKIINKFLCQLFFLIFFTNKIDIKPENVLVEKKTIMLKLYILMLRIFHIAPGCSIHLQITNNMVGTSTNCF